MVFSVQGGDKHPKPPSITPVSPNASEFAKYSETQLNLSTGANTLTIPLHNIEMEGLNIPINLSYTGTAIRVDQAASTYGLGWVMNGGGMISLSKVDGVGMKALFDINKLDLLENKYEEGTLIPYKFNYNFSGYSGQFYKKPNGQIVNLGDPRLKITTLNIGFKVTTPDGITYYFGEEDGYTYSTLLPSEYSNKVGDNPFGRFDLDMPLGEYMAMVEDVTIPNLYFNGRDLNPTYSNEINQWLLRKITFPNSNEIIVFHYETSRVMGPPDQYCLIDEYSYVPIDQTVNPFENEYIHRSFTFTRSNDRPLLSITWPNGKIQFEYDGRLDATCFASTGNVTEGEVQYEQGMTSYLAIKKMKIYDNSNNFIKGFEFGFKYSNNNSLDPLDKRMFLQSINEYSISNKMPPYIFDYEGFDVGAGLPHLLSNAQDLFGYYNGENFVPTHPGMGFPYLDWHKVNLMHKIPYLTNLGPGRPVSEENLQTFLNSINALDYPSSFLIDQGYLRQSQKNSLPIIYYDRRTTPFISMGMLNKLEYPTGGIDAFSYSVDTVQYFYKGQFRGLIGGGVKLTTVYRTYGLGNQPPTEKKYYYESGKLLYLPFFAKSYFDATTTDVHKIRDVFYSTPINRQNGSTVMYPKVTEVTVNFGKTVYEYDVPTYFGKNANSTFTIQSINPELDYTNLSGSSNYPQYDKILDYFPYSSASNFDWANGKLMKQITYNQSGKKIEQIDNEYSEVLYGNYNTFEVVTLNDIVKKIGYNYTGLDLTTDGVFRFSKSHLISAWRPLTKTTKTVFDPTDPNKTKIVITDYTYNNSNQLVRSQKQTNSDGREYLTKNRYANDFYELGSDEESLGIAALQEKHLINTMIETSDYYFDPELDTTKFLISSYLTLYKNFNQNILPWKVESLEPLTPLVNFIPVQNDINNSNLIKDSRYKIERTFTKYNDRGKLVEMLDRKSGYVSFKWGYNQNLPISKIDNARTSLDVIGNESSYIGFESGLLGSVDQDYWSFNSSKVELVYTPFTGKVGLKASPHSTHFMYKTFQSDGGIKKVKVSGWVKISQNSYSNIQPKEFKIELMDGISNLVSSQSFYTNPNMSEWKFFSALFDLPSNSVNGNIITYTIGLKNPTDQFNYELIFDDIRVQPNQSTMVTYTYTDKFDLPTSVSDDKNVPTHFEYDEIGRLISIKDYKKNILKTNVYMYSPKQ